MILWVILSFPDSQQYDDTAIKADISALQAEKVDKVDGMSLIEDAEKERLSAVTNYDDTEIRTEIAECMAKEVSVATLKKRFYYAEDDALTKYGANIIVWQESGKSSDGKYTQPCKIAKDDVSSHGFHISVLVQQTAKIEVIVIDYATGLVYAKINKNLSSSVGFKGLAKKGLMLSIVAIANIIDTQVIKSGSAFRSAVICFYLANESISIFENAGKLGVPLPKKLKEILIQLREDNND